MIFLYRRGPLVANGARKYKVDKTLDKYNARLVAKGFSLKTSIDKKDTFAPRAKIGTIWLVLALAS